MSQLTICQSPFGLKPSLSGKRSGFWNPSPQGGRWGSLLCCHGKEEWSQTSSWRLSGALWAHSGLAGSRSFPVLSVLALESATGNLRPLFSGWAVRWCPPSWCHKAFWGLAVTSTCLLAWTALHCRVILLHPDDPSGKQVRYFPLPSLVHPENSEYFPYKKEISGDPPNLFSA